VFGCPPLCTFPDIDAAWCVLVVSLCRLAPTSEWDTAAADIIVREAGGVVLQAGKVTGKGELLEDWQVRFCCCKAASASNSTTASTSHSKQHPQAAAAAIASVLQQSGCQIYTVSAACVLAQHEHVRHCHAMLAV
jgi:hypothetical protein